jgi:hypothetical protein
MLLALLRYHVRRRLLVLPLDAQRTDCNHLCPSAVFCSKSEDLVPAGQPLRLGRSGHRGAREAQRGSIGREWEEFVRAKARNNEDLLLY